MPSPWLRNNRPHVCERGRAVISSFCLSGDSEVRRCRRQPNRWSQRAGFPAEWYSTSPITPFRFAKEGKQQSEDDVQPSPAREGSTANTSKVSVLPRWHAFIIQQLTCFVKYIPKEIRHKINKKSKKQHTGRFLRLILHSALVNSNVLLFFRD